MEIKKNNPKYKALYQEYDWCYDRYIIKRMSHQEMADELGVKKRVIQKWCVEKHHLHQWSIRRELKLTDEQKQLIIWGTLGDGHIDKRETQPMYIESHAEDEKDYLYWKYNILKNICNEEPKYYKPNKRCFNNKTYDCQATYRMCTKIIDELYEIRKMSNIEKINTMDWFGLCLYILDDGSRSNSNWEICVANLKKQEKELFIKLCIENLCLSCKIKKDDRYIEYSSDSSRIIDKKIQEILPTNLDIVNKKILSKNITKPNNYIYVLLNDGNKIGLSYYFRKLHTWEKYHCILNYLRDMNIKEIAEDELYEKIQQLS